MKTITSFTQHAQFGYPNNITAVKAPLHPRNTPGRNRKPVHRDPLPRKVLAFRTEPKQPFEQAATDDRPIRAVVVNDSPRMLKTLSSVLEEQGDVQLIGTATDGHHAVRRAIELEPDLVLIDLRLPLINGLDVTRQIKARPQPPAVIMVSAEDTPEHRAAAHAAGTDHFVGQRHIFTQLPVAIRKQFPKKHSDS